jgi:hypothetical protein
VEQRRGAYKVLVKKPKGKRPLVRPSRRWGITLRWICREWDGGGMDWIDLVQDRDRWRATVNVAMNFGVP